MVFKSAFLLFYLHTWHLVRMIFILTYLNIVMKRIFLCMRLSPLSSLMYIAIVIYHKLTWNLLHTLYFSANLNSVFRVSYIYFLRRHYFSNFSQYISSPSFYRNTIVGLVINCYAYVIDWSVEYLGWWLQCFVKMCDNGLFNVVPMPNIGNCLLNYFASLRRDQRY
jgi:hypothetical protein